MGRYAIARVGCINGTITQTLRGRFDECDVWGTWCVDVGTAVQIVSLLLLFFLRGGNHQRRFVSEIRGPWDAATPRGFERWESG
jgi:hypothetical protein